MLEAVEPYTLPWSGEVVFCAGLRDGLPVFGWRKAPAGLATRRGLRKIGLSRRGLEPRALLVFGHRRPFRREEVAELYLVAEAQPVLPMTPGEWAAHAAMMRARKTCRTCKRVVDHCVRGPKRQCAGCYDADPAAHERAA